MRDLGTICISLIVVPILAIITFWPQIYIKIFRNGDSSYNPRALSVKPEEKTDTSHPTSTNQ